MPPRRSAPKILHQAGELRKETAPAEKKLWAYLRLMREDGICFRRQHAIGYKVIRFWNNDVMNNIEGVILVIMDALEKQE